MKKLIVFCCLLLSLTSCNPKTNAEDKDSDLNISNQESPDKDKNEELKDLTSLIDKKYYYEDKVDGLYMMNYFVGKEIGSDELINSIEIEVETDDQVEDIYKYYYDLLIEDEYKDDFDKDSFLRVDREEGQVFIKIKSNEERLEELYNFSQDNNKKDVFQGRNSYSISITKKEDLIKSNPHNSHLKKLLGNLLDYVGETNRDLYSKTYKDIDGIPAEITRLEYDLDVKNINRISELIEEEHSEKENFYIEENRNDETDELYIRWEDQGYLIEIIETVLLDDNTAFIEIIIEAL